ncbi:hypothetical protein [Aquabacterium sp. CECT 9606]|uniref:AMP-binding enzyme n=1 Tax=Aquabacterium sp. CECT 9606 TaxID=2845822 RepID=UPI001E42115F|nr:hypothetical protein [Aquabacterium sp. CECT 9606]CAH0349920.1 hypothetical protein AQB9606_01314 [Aquabacterium sp. CECT 9606]
MTASATKPIRGLQDIEALESSMPDLMAGQHSTYALLSEVPMVYVQLRPGSQATVDELMTHAKSTIAERAAHPKLVRVVDVLPTTVIGKIFKPTLIQREVESVFMDEASALGVQVVSAKASQDAKLGLVLRWQARGDVTALKARLDGFIFRHEQLPT